MNPNKRRYEGEVITVAGVVTGATTGAFAGPPGIAAGAVIGAAIGMTVGRALDREDERKHRRDEVLDEEIGVSAGDLGASPSSTVSHGEADDVTSDDQALLESLEGPPAIGADARSASDRSACAAGPATSPNSPGPGWPETR